MLQGLLQREPYIKYTPYPDPKLAVKSKSLVMCELGGHDSMTKVSHHPMSHLIEKKKY